MRFSGQISDFALGSGLIQRTRLTALYSRSTGDTHLRLLPHTPSRANQRLASLWTSRGAPQQCTCLLGVEFPLSGPQVWTFTSCSLLMPDTLPLRGLGPGFTLDAAAPPTPASSAASRVACTVRMRDCLIDVLVRRLRVAQSAHRVLPAAGEHGWMCRTALRQIRSVGRSAQRHKGGRPRGRKDSRGAECAAGRIPPTTDPSSRALPQVARRVIRRN